MSVENEGMLSETPIEAAGFFSRSGIQFAVLPLSAGVMGGICVNYVLWAHSASLLDCSIFLSIMGASCLYFLLAIIIISAVADILFNISDVANPWRLERRHSWTIVLLGVSYAIIPITLAAFATRYSSGNPVAIPTFRLSKDFIIPFGLVVPFLTVRRKRDESGWRKLRVARWAGALVFCVVVSWMISKRVLNVPSLDRLRDCNAVVAWVRSTHSAPGDYKDLSLPTSLDYLSNDRRVEAVLLSDGRVILLFQSETPWISFCRYTLFSNTALTGYETGVDHPDPWFTSHWGYPELRVNGLPNFCIFSTLSPNDYIVGMNN